MNERLHNISYTLLPGKPRREFGEVELHNKVYKFRNDFWANILSELFGDRRNLTGDDFMRQDVVAVLTYGDDVIGLQCYTFFDMRLSSAREHTFITKYFDETFLRRLSDMQAHYVMSIEYFSIHPEWRSSKVGLSLGRVLLSLGLQVAATNGVHASIAAARDDVPASAMASEMGARRWAKGIQVLGCPTDLVVFFPDEVRSLQNIEEKEFARKLWMQRFDYLDVEQTGSFKNIA